MHSPGLGTTPGETSPPSIVRVGFFLYTLSMRLRPRHLKRRVSSGVAFGEDAVLVQREPGERDLFGEWLPGVEIRTDIRVASRPGSHERKPSMAAVRESGDRMFLIDGPLSRAIRTSTSESIATDGDVIEYRGDVWRVVDVESWDESNYGTEVEPDIDYSLVVSTRRSDPQ